MRIRSAIGEAEKLSVYDVTSPSQRKANLMHIIYALRPGDVTSSVKRQMAQLREELQGMAREQGTSTVTIAVTPAKARDTEVVVDTDYNPLRC